MGMIGRTAAGMQKFAFSVRQPRRFFRHNSGKHLINSRQDLRHTAKITIQIDTPLHGLRLPTKPFIFFQKQRRIRQAEAINTLLYVADHKAIIRPRHQLRNQFLHTVGILIFVN